MSDPILAAIETHRVAVADLETSEAETKGARFRSRREVRQRDARERYQSRTDALISTPIASMAGLLAFSRYVADLHAYGRPGGAYHVEVWHLSDALDAVAQQLAVLLPTAAAPD